MSAFVAEKFVTSGVYSIVNSGQGKTITIGANSVVSSSTDTHAWAIVMSAEKKWQLRCQATGDSWGVNLKSDTIHLRPPRHKPQQWVIKRCSATTDSYILYSTSYPGRFLTLSDTREQASLTLSRDANNPRAWWKFRNTGNQDMPNFGAMMSLDEELANSKRPRQLNISENQIAVVIPTGWDTVLSAVVPISGMTSLVRVHHSVDGLLTTREFVSRDHGQGHPGGALGTMIVNGTGMDSHAILAEDRPAVMTFEIFNPGKTTGLDQDPLDLPEYGNLSSDLRVVSAGRPDSARHMRDYQIYDILDHSPVPGSTRHKQRGGINTILHVQLSNTADTAVDLDDPGTPEPATAVAGFHDAMDMPRPNTMVDYMTNYDIIFVVDDSVSMKGARWNEVRLALTELAKEAMQYDAEGLEICFLNSTKQKQFIADPAEMLDIFDTVQPRGWTYTGKKLKTILDRVVKRLNNEVGKPGYADIKPVDIVVLTDGAPTDDPADAIEDAIKKLDMGRHHLNAVGIQFVQIGDEDGARAALELLKDCPLRKMVDTVPYTKALTPQRLSEVLLGTLHPSIRSALAQKASTKVVECPICGSDDIPEYEYPRFPPTRRCQHLPMACKECIARHVEVQIFDKAGLGALTISCPSYPCPEKLGYDEIRQWATPECFKRYNSIDLRQRLANDPNFRWCLGSKCNHGQIHELGDGYPVVQCVWCYKKSCFTHQLPWHEGLTCAEFDTLRPDWVAGEDATKATINNTTMQCTRCKNRVEKKDGCDYITCRCGHGFCWRCGASIAHNEVWGSRTHLQTCPLYR